MKYKLFIFCPDDPGLITRIIDAASSAGAGIMGNYTHSAFVSKGEGQWFSGRDTHPAIGKPGTMSHEPEARIEMEYTGHDIKSVDAAIRSVHPYEEPAIEFIKIEASR